MTDHCTSTRAMPVTDIHELKDHLETKGRHCLFFSKFEHTGCTATKRKVCLGPGIEIQVMQEPLWGKKSWKRAKFPPQFSGRCAK